MLWLWGGGACKFNSSSAVSSLVKTEASHVGNIPTEHKVIEPPEGLSDERVKLKSHRSFNYPEDFMEPQGSVSC
jgi:hypothetical protein